MEMATTKDVSSIKQRMYQLIATQHQQQETLVHIISVWNVTRYATQVKRQHINVVMDIRKDTPGYCYTLQHHKFNV